MVNRGLRRREAPACPAGRGTLAVPDEGGGRRDTRCSCRERVTSRGRGQGEKRWWRRGFGTGVKGDPVGNLGHGRVGCGREVVVKVGVREGGMPAGGKRRAVAKVACLGLEEGLRAWVGDEAGPKIRVQESTGHEVGTFNGGGRARGSGVGDRWEKSGVFEGKEGIREVRKGLANAREASGGGYPGGTI